VKKRKNRSDSDIYAVTEPLTLAEGGNGLGVPAPPLPPAPASPGPAGLEEPGPQLEPLAAQVPAPAASLEVSAQAPAPAPAEDALEPLMQRIRRLEDALAQLQPAPAKEPAPPHAILRAPVAVPVAQGAPGSVAPVVMPDSQRRPAVLSVPSSTAHVWLLGEGLAEARAIFRMYVDPRYRLSWLARILPAVLALSILLSGFWNPLAHLPLVGWLLDKVVDLVLAFALFKFLSHEARRYRETAPDLPPSLRL
jgi:hypothetical protein